MPEPPAAVSPDAYQPRPDVPHRRLPGAQLPSTAPATLAVAPGPPPSRDAAAARARMDDYQSGLARAGEEPLESRAERVAPATGRATVPVGGRPPILTQRVPGTHLAPGLRERPVDIPAQRGAGRAKRDPDAERAAFDSYTSGWALGGAQGGSGRTTADDYEWMKENSQ